MSKVIGTLGVLVLAVFMAFGAGGTAQADRSVRDAVASDLYVRDADPSLDALSAQFAALWNPNIPLAQKLAVSYHGDKLGPVLAPIMAPSSMYDLFSIQQRVTSKSINGDRMSANLTGVAAGFPATSGTYYYVREGGLWKVDWKVTCDHMGGCNGNPNFGY